MKNSHWKPVMFVTVLIMLSGLCVAWHGISHHDINQAYLGLLTVGIVCASWWFWVMFIIKHMINLSSRTDQGLIEIKREIKAVKSLLTDK